MDLVSLIRRDGADLKKVATTNGGEYVGPCPWCGGRDRFRVWPEVKGGRYWCRGCGKSGDAIQYLRDTQGLSFFEAQTKLGIEMTMPKCAAKRQKAIHTVFAPKDHDPPNPVWIQKAFDFLQKTQEALYTQAGHESRQFLHDRGLNDETIRKYGIGFIEKDLYFDQEAWGIPVETTPQGYKKNIWFPSGIVIPCYDKGKQLVRLRVRRSKPRPGEDRYIVASGGKAAYPMRMEADKTEIAVVVESELDGILIFQEASDIVNVLALGSVNIRPDRPGHAMLMRSKYILVSLDSDEIGATNSWSFWSHTYGDKAKRWPVPIGKDPGEAYQEGLNIRLWIESGISE